jgi:hypothetical protein
MIALINIHNDLHYLICGKLKVESNGSFKLATFYPLPSSVCQLRAAAIEDSERSGPSYLLWEECTGDKVAEFVRLIALSLARRITFNFISCLQNDS